MLLFLKLMLLIFDFSKTINWMKKRKDPFYFAGDLNRNKKAIEFSSKLIPNCTCLIQAIAFKVLVGSDLGTKLVIGVSKKEQFESHAWVCRRNIIVFGGSGSAKKFTKLVEF